MTINPPQPWDALVAAYEIATADCEGLGESYSDLECDFYADAQFAALVSVLIAPAPDIAALARKLRIFAAEDAGELRERQRLYAALIADAESLASRAKPNERL